MTVCLGYAQVPCTSTTTNGSGTLLNLYWVGHLENGGSGDWSNPCSWRVGSVTSTESPAQGPRPKDNVFFADAAFTATNSTININADAFCASFNMDNTFTNGVNFSQQNASRKIEVGDATNGGFNLANTNLNFDYRGKVILKWAGTHAIDFNSQDLKCIIQVNNPTGVFNLNSSVSSSNYINTTIGNAPVRVIAGTLNTNNNTFTIPSLAVETGGIINAGTSVFNFNGALRHPHPVYHRTTIFNEGSLNFSSTIVNVNTNETTTQIRSTSTNDTFGTINLNNPNTIYDLGFIDATGNISTSTNNQLLIGGTVGGDLSLEGGVTLKLKSDLSVNTLTQTANVNCSSINRIESTNSTARTLTSSANVSLHDVELTKIIAGNSISNGGSGAISYTITDAIDGGGNQFWDLTTLPSRNIAWTGGGTDNLWTTAANWDIGCVPNIQDNVTFANMTGKTVDLNINGEVNNFIWTEDTSTGTFTNSNSSNLTIGGDFTLNTTMTWLASSNINLLGASNTINTPNQTISGNITLDNSANYTLLSNLSAGRLRIINYSDFTAANKTINIDQLYALGFSSLVFNADNCVININSNQGFYDYHGSLNFNFSNGTIMNFTSANPNISGHPAYSNTTFNLPSFTTAVNSTLNVFRNESASLVANDNVTIGGSVFFNGNSVTDVRMKNVTINGDLSITGNHQFYFPPNGKFTVTGNLNLTDTGCDKPTVMSTPVGITDQSEFDIQGTISGLDYIIAKNLNATGYQTITATNSTDLGGNDNWTFTSGSTGGITYYWRADTTNPTVFDGNWNDANHWTTNSTKTVGDGSCSVPNFGDNVVFDNLSFNGTTTSIVPSSIINVNDFTVSNSNVNFTTNTTFYIDGNLNTDTTLSTTGNNNYYFTSTGTAGKTISTGPITGSALFIGSDTWTLSQDLSTSSSIRVSNGNFNSDGFGITTNTFIVSSNGSTVNLSNSDVSVSTWNMENQTNIDFTAPSSIIVALMIPSNLTYNNVTAKSGSNFRINEPAGATFDYVSIGENSIINGNNTFNTLEYIPASGVTYTHQLQGGSIQNITSPNGQIMATGLNNGFLNIKSTNATQATIHKDYGGQMCWDFVILENLDATEDTDQTNATPNIFGGLNNTTTNVGGTLFDFTRATFVAPTVDSGPDQDFCRRTAGSIAFNFTNSGPYTVTYTDGTNTFVESGISHGTSQIYVPVYESTVYTITNIEGDNCGTLVPGSIIDATQEIVLPPLSNMAVNGDVSSCYLGDEGVWVHFVSNDTNTRAMSSVLDTQDGVSLGNIATEVGVESSTYMDSALGNIYMRRHTGIDPDVENTSLVRLYFTQAELDQFSIDVTGSSGNVALSNLKVMLYENNAMDFSGNNQELTVINSGSEAAVPMVEALDFTSEADVFYVDVNTTKFGHFNIFADPNMLNTDTFTVNDYNIVVYPNPAKDYLKVKANPNTNIKAIELFDLLGKKILSAENTRTLNVQHVNAGTYFVNVITGVDTVSMKIVIE